MENKIVIYTAIFGSRDTLLEPQYIPEGVDFVCFTDQPFSSEVWKIRQVEPKIPDDLTRSNRYFKILTHEVLPEYEYSIYIDGNVIVTEDVTELISTYLNGAHFAAFDCARYSPLPMGSVADQAAQLLKPGQDKRNNESYENIRAQAEAYKKEGFPDDDGHIMGMVLVRKHNEEDVVAAMNAWWHEVMTRSKRDLMSFNYVAWKLQFCFNYIPLDGADNPYVLKVRHHQSASDKLMFRLRTVWKRFRQIFVSK